MASSKPKKTANKTKKSPTKETVKSEKSEKTKDTEVVTKKEIKEVEAVVEEPKKEVEEKGDKKVAHEKASEEKVVIVETKKCGFFSSVFAKRYDENENILTIFSSKKIYGALIAEALGTMILSLVLLTLGLYQPLYIFFVILGVTGMTFALSGANLNPLLTVGMMATRRMSVIRGVLYILAQIFGAWLGYLVCTIFVSETAGATLPEMASIESETMWSVILIEFVGSLLLALAYARALASSCKKNPLAFSTIFAGGAVAAFITVIVISSTFAGLSNNFMMNPAIALMYQILPTGGDTLGEVLGEIGIALLTYVLVPMVAGFIGFFISGACDYFVCDCEEKVCEK